MVVPKNKTKTTRVMEKNNGPGGDSYDEWDHPT